MQRFIEYYSTLPQLLSSSPPLRFFFLFFILPFFLQCRLVNPSLSLSLTFSVSLSAFLPVIPSISFHLSSSFPPPFSSSSYSSFFFFHVISSSSPSSSLSSLFAPPIYLPFLPFPRNLVASNSVRIVPCILDLAFRSPPHLDRPTDRPRPFPKYHKPRNPLGDLAGARRDYQLLAGRLKRGA